MPSISSMGFLSVPPSLTLYDLQRNPAFCQRMRDVHAEIALRFPAIHLSFLPFEERERVTHEFVTPTYRATSAPE